MNTKKNVRLGCLCALGSETFYGFSYLFTKNSSGHASALALLGWRFLIAVLVMSGCCLAGLVRVQLRGKSLKPLFLVALCSPVVYFIGETFGIQMTTASESGSFLACTPVASLIASSLILHERPKKLQTAGILVSLTGVLVTVFAAGSSSSFSLSGYLILTVAVISYCDFHTNLY